VKGDFGVVKDFEMQAKLGLKVMVEIQLQANSSRFHDLYGTPSLSDRSGNNFASP
jgi:hypothetical protein